MVGLQIQPDVENGDPPIDFVSETDGDGGGRWTGSDDDGRRHQLLPRTPQVDMTRSFPQGPGKRHCTQAFWLGVLGICVLTTPRTEGTIAKSLTQSGMLGRSRRMERQASR